jgi:protein-L-isoaspartate O-methyltransferase
MGGGYRLMAREKEMQHMLEDIVLEVKLTRSYTGYERFSEAVMKAMAAVPRHEFVPPDMQLFAYANGPLSIGHGQTLLLITVSIWKILQCLCTSSPISRSMMCIGFVSGFMMDCSTFHCRGVW